MNELFGTIKMRWGIIIVIILYMNVI